MNIKKHIPNAITCGNLLCGCLAIVKAFEGDLVWAAYLVGIALVLDFFDGFTARLLKVASPIGKDLDSLADMVTFGVVPGIVMFQIMSFSHNSLYTFDFGPSLKYFAFAIPVFSAIRLAKFNNDTRQSDSFIGLPTPANAIVICSIPLIFAFQNSTNGLMQEISQNFNGNYTPIKEEFVLGNIVFGEKVLLWSLNQYALCLVSLIMSLLLVAPLPLLALKFKNFGWADNKMRFILIGLVVICIAVFQFIGIPLAIILYILLSVINNIINKQKA